MSKYLALAAEGLVQELACPMDKGLLACNQDLEDNIYLYCLSCEYKKTVGLAYYQDLLKVVQIHEHRESFSRDGSIDYEVQEWKKNN